MGCEIKSGLQSELTSQNDYQKRMHSYFCSINFPYYSDVSKNRGTPKWMVKIMENPIRMDDLGVPLFLETPIENSTHVQRDSRFPTVSLKNGRLKQKS